MELNKIYNVDCLEFMKTMPDNSVDLVVTSPPYNKNSAKRKPHPSDAWSKAGIDYGEYKDDMEEVEYQAWQKEIVKESLRILKPDGSLFYNHKPRLINHKAFMPNEWLSEFNIRQMIIWNRKSSCVLEPIRFMPTVEYIYWITKERKTPKFNPEAFQYKEVWEISPAAGNEHPAPYPEEIPTRCILSCSHKDDIIFDPFMGSGTTAIACLKTNRRFIGCEISPKYCEIANKRIDNYLAQGNLFS